MGQAPNPFLSDREAIGEPGRETRSPWVVARMATAVCGGCLSRAPDEPFGLSLQGT